MANPKPEPLHQARATYCPNVATPTPAAAMAAPVPITEASTGSSSLQPVLLGVSVLVGEKKKRIKGKKKKKALLEMEEKNPTRKEYQEVTVKVQVLK